MKIFISVLTLFIMTFASPVAADLFVKKKTDSAQEQTVAPLKKTPAPIAQENTAPTTPTPAPQTTAQDTAAPAPSINDFANGYYKNCKKQKHPVLKGEALELMCGCTSAQIPQVMTVEQMQASQTDTPEGLVQRNRILTEVYTPCIHFPAKALILNQCQTNPQVKSSMKQYKKVCKCLASNMAEFMEENAPSAIKAALAKNAGNIDPLRTLLESPAFSSASQEYMKSCVMQHEFGRG